MSRQLPNTLHVARREYLVRVRSRTFAITTALVAIGLVVLTLLPTLFSGAGFVDEPPSVALDVQAQDLPFDPASALSQLLTMAGGGGPLPGGPSTEPPSVTTTDDPAAAVEAVRAEELDGLLTIRRAESGELEFEYLSTANPMNDIRALVQQAAISLAISDRLARAGIGPEQSAEIFSPPEFTDTTPEASDPPDAAYGGALLIAYFVVVFTFMAVLTYGHWIAQSVVEEKSNRVMELLITAATPRQLLTGKVLGTGAAGLTQYAITLAAFGIGLLASGPVSALLSVDANPFPIPAIEAWMLPSFVTFFLLGFSLYSALYAAAGSLVSRSEDVQQAVGPLILLVMVGYFLSFGAINDPDGRWVATLSLIPFFSPYLMPMRMLLTNVGAAEILAALAILVVSLIAALWLASRIYSAGVLMYGQRAGLRKILRAARVNR